MIEKNKTIVVIAAHPDDEVIGCGGSIARFRQEGKDVHILLMTDGVSSRNQDPNHVNIDDVTDRNNHSEKANKILGTSSVTYLNFPDNMMDSVSMLSVVKEIESFLEKHKPDIVFTHHSGDVNIDHRIVHDAVIVACRPQPGYYVKELLFFEIASSSEWQSNSFNKPFLPNMFIDISSTIQKKADALNEYEIETREFPHPRSIEAIKALSKWRGSNVGVSNAESFMIGRMIK